MATIEKVNKLPTIYDYKEFLMPFRRGKKKVLLSYLTTPLLDDLNSKKNVRFSNNGIALSWAQVLNELGYIVDIIDWDNSGFLPKHEYDLVVFHGGKNFDKIFPNLSGDPKIIHFLTGSYWKFNNKAEDARIEDFQKRHKTKAERDRYIYASEDPVNEAADGIIVLGDPSMRSTYPSEYPVVLTINNASYPDDHFNKIEKDYDVAKYNFLFFAGSGNIHKGLDLLIDAFKDLDEHLYIVTVPDKKVLSVFRDELKLPNIHLLGEVGLRSPDFYKSMDRCAFVILPSCSEGQAGSVVEAMNQGLIPIVSKETRLDARSYGLVLDNNKIETIRHAVKHMASLKPQEVEKKARMTRKIAISDHNPEKFRKDLKKAIKTILKTR